MALLLRMAGLPARVATGFTPGGYSERHNAWIVRDTDAHAWVEVWFDEFGWVTLDPTPDATPARSQVAALAAPPSSTPLVPDRGPGAVRRGRRERTPSPASAPSCRSARAIPTAAASTPGSDFGWLRWFGLAVLVVAALLALLLFIRRPRGKTPMDRAIAEVEAAMRRVGRPVTTGTTLGQLESRLGSHSPGGARVLPGAGLGPLRAGLGPAVTRGPARVAACIGFRAWVHRAAAGVVGDAAAVRAAELASRGRACSRSRPAFAVSRRLNGSIEGVWVDRDRSSADRVRAQTLTTALRTKGVGNETARIGQLWFPTPSRRLANRSRDPHPLPHWLPFAGSTAAVKVTRARPVHAGPHASRSRLGRAVRAQSLERHVAYTYGIAHPPRTISSPASRAPTSTYASVRP